MEKLVERKYSSLIDKWSKTRETTKIENTGIVSHSFYQSSVTIYCCTQKVGSGRWNILLANIMRQMKIHVDSTWSQLITKKSTFDSRVYRSKLTIYRNFMLQNILSRRCILILLIYGITNYKVCNQIEKIYIFYICKCEKIF
jgi:hypothetical protein